MSPLHAGMVLWFWFAASWAAAMPWSGRATRRGGAGAAMLYLLGYVIAFLLLFSTPIARMGRVLNLSEQVPPHLWRDPALLGWALVIAQMAGLSFAWWARLHIGRLWSGMMTLRESHRVVESGPYRLVRHPIYTGILAAAWALALNATSLPALAGAAMLTLVMIVKARAEERLLRQALGDAYDAYASRTPMLVPVPKAKLR